MGNYSVFPDSTTGLFRVYLAKHVFCGISNSINTHSFRLHFLPFPLLSLSHEVSSATFLINNEVIIPFSFHCLYIRLPHSLSLSLFSFSLAPHTCFYFFLFNFKAVVFPLCGIFSFSFLIWKLHYRDQLLIG